jgi:hypothetical protein
MKTPLVITPSEGVVHVFIVRSFMSKKEDQQGRKTLKLIVSSCVHCVGKSFLHNLPINFVPFSALFIGRHCWE